MHILTLWEPWARVLGFEKGIETRGHHTNYRGKLAIHSAKRKIKKAEIQAIIEELYDTCGVDQVNELKDIFEQDLPLQHILSVVEVINCQIMVDKIRAYGWKDLNANRVSLKTKVAKSKEELFEDAGFDAVHVDEPIKGFLAVAVDQDKKGNWHEAIVISEQTPLELALGLWEPGRFAWIVKNAVRLPEPIYKVGEQGLKPLSEEYEEKLRRQLEQVEAEKAYLGNHSVGKAFAKRFQAIGIEKINEMSVEELLEELDSVGNNFRLTDAEFEQYDYPDHPFGHALMRIWGQDLPLQPSPDSKMEAHEKWNDLWWKAVKEPFCQRYSFY